MIKSIARISLVLSAWILLGIFLGALSFDGTAKDVVPSLELGYAGATLVGLLIFGICFWDHEESD